MKSTVLEPTTTESWLSDLAVRGARIEGNRVVDFGDPKAELAAATDGTVMCDLSHFGLIAARGVDTDAFLQGQLSSDIRQLSPSRAQLSSYNTPKGRMLASFLMFWNSDAIYLQLPHELIAPIRKRLALFILRSKVQLVDASDELVRVGVAGKEAEALLGSALGALPATLFEMVQTDAASAIRLPGNRFEIVAKPERATTLWEKLAERARPTGAPVWDWLEIQAGIPAITITTQDQFIPQMANLDLLGGVSFQKGCYPGQEIVARTQYLGRLKRRMYLAHVETRTAPTPGSEVFSADLVGQATGMIVNASAAPEGGFDVLAVIQISSAAAQPIHLGSPAGPVLELRPLPYPFQPAS